MRLGRITKELTADGVKPTADEVEAFYEENIANFRKADTFHAAHTVCHVNQHQTESHAQARIEAALAELESGADFAVVAERHSDCKGSGGDLVPFPAGYMVEEFEDAIGALAPGERSGIFTTPFGFHIVDFAPKLPVALRALTRCVPISSACSQLWSSTRNT